MKRMGLYTAGILLTGIVLYWKGSEIAGIAIVLMYAAAFSLILTPACAKLERHGLRASLAAGCAVIGLFLIALLIIAALIPYLFVQLSSLFERISPIAAEIMLHLQRSAEDGSFAGSHMVSLSKSMRDVLGEAAGLLVKAGMSTATQIGRIGFSLVLTYYILSDRKRIACHLALFIPTSWRSPALKALRACKNALLGYSSGLLKTSVFISAATCVGLIVLGIPDAFLLALLMGVLEILPYAGPILASIPIVLSAMLEGGKTVWMTIAMLIAVQQLEGNFVSPYFMASSVSVRPLAAVFWVFTAGSIFGIWGILIAMPVLVMIKSLLFSARQICCSMDAAA